MIVYVFEEQSKSTNTYNFIRPDGPCIPHLGNFGFAQFLKSMVDESEELTMLRADNSKASNQK
jgi:hypothetical protein